MAKYVVRFLGMLRVKTGEDVIQLELPDEATVEQLLKRLEEMFPNLGDFLSFEAYSKGRIDVLVNGRSSSWIGGLNARIRPSDEILVVPPAAGG